MDNYLAEIFIFIIGLFIGKFLPSYLNKKGENLATKEDIAEITHKIEEVKSVHLIKLKKNTILLDEKIRVFKNLQNRLISFKKYCEASYGEFGGVSEFHATLLTLPEEIDKAALIHITALHNIKQEDFIFLSEKSRFLLQSLIDDSMILASIELSIDNHETEEDVKQGVAEAYINSIKRIDECLIGLYEELEFSSIQR